MDITSGWLVLKDRFLTGCLKQQKLIKSERIYIYIYIYIYI